MKIMMNVLLITIDSLRPDYLGCYGNSENLTPHIDSIAEQSVVFESVISQGPRTAESFPAIMSGNYGSKYLDLYDGLSEERHLISETLRENGYHTAAFNSNPYISKYRNYNRGFDHFVDNISEIKSIRNHWLRLKLMHLKTFFKEPYTPADEVNEQVFSWLKNKPEPYFLWAHYMDVHGPYVPKSGWALKNRIMSGLLWKKSTNRPEQLTEKEKKLLEHCYKEEVKYTDKRVKDLLDNIDHESTVVIIMSDHGEFMGEHGLFGHPPFYLYDPLLKIPLIVKLPGALKTEKRSVRRTVKSLDIVPTILDLVDIKHDQPLDGESLLPLMRGKDIYKCEYFISEIWADHLSVRTDKWKLIYRIQDGKKSLELYDLEDDPREENNIAGQRQDIIAEMENIVKDHMEKNDAPSKDREASSFETDNEEIKEQLKKLGYM